MIALFLAASNPIMFTGRELVQRREMAGSTRAAPKFPKRVSSEQMMLDKVFGDYCLASNLNREKFDALVAGTPDLLKVSTPFSWGGEFNRRWQYHSIELSYLDAPAPAALSCAVMMKRADGLEPEGLQDLVGFSVTSTLKLVRSENGFSQWSTKFGEGRMVFVNIFPTHAEVILSGARKASDVR